MAALDALADGTPEMSGVYVVTCPNCSPVCCTTLEGAMAWAEHMAHIDAGPLDPFIDAEVHRDGCLVYVYDCYRRAWPAWALQFDDTCPPRRR